MSATSYDPRTGLPVATVEDTTPEQFAVVVGCASQAAGLVAAASPAERCGWLYSIAAAMEAHAEELTDLADIETALGRVRLEGEVARMAGQLRFYGEVALEGSYLGVAVDEATPASPRIVRVNRPLGPVAVFGASNFPFAFGALGNDTGAAIAAGCPVVVKAHSAHVGLTLRQAEIAREALAEVGAPEGTLGVVVGRAVGVDLVKARQISAVAFTGSQDGGLALWRIANERDEVIPMYAEMGTVNPVIVTRARGGDMSEVAAGLVGSFTLGSGQFCTKPGIMFAPAGIGAAEAVAEALRRAAPRPTMLTESISASVSLGLSEMESAGAEIVATVEHDGPGWRAPAAVLRADLSAIRTGSRLLAECFGAVVLVCDYHTDQQLEEAISVLQPSLVASLFAGGEDDDQGPGLIATLSAKVGRVAVNDWPTGVSNTWAQQHGGPWPSTSVPSASSVGAHALARFVRPIAFQSVREGWLPPEARDANPWALPRRLNGRIDVQSVRRR